MSTHTCDLYVQVEAERRGWAPSGDEKRVTGLKAVAMTQRRPAKPKPGSVIVKLSLQIPDQAFSPLRPEAVVVIPTDLTDPQPIVVEAVDPTEGDQ